VVEVKSRTERGGLCAREENRRVGSISIRIKRVEKENKRDRRLKKSMISTSSLPTRDFLTQA
jgi:hypothetical protein